MTIVDKIPDGIYYSRYPKDCPVDKDGRPCRNGEWKTVIGVVIIDSKRTEVSE
jgi:hypothetical protein